jgi:hypothetical protein
LHCVKELTDILKEHTQAFVDSLFDAIESTILHISKNIYITVSLGESYKDFNDHDGNDSDVSYFIGYLSYLRYVFRMTIVDLIDDVGIWMMTMFK